MDRKNSFIVYHDNIELFNCLSNEDLGTLFRAMFKYSATKEHVELPQHLQLVFIQLRQQIDRNEEKYQIICDKNKENIEKRWNTKDTTVYDRIRPDTKHTDKDKDKEKDTDKEKEPDNKYPSLTSLTEKDFQEIATNYKVHLKTVTSAYGDLTNYCQSHGKRYKNYKAALRNFVAKDIKDNPNLVIKAAYLKPPADLPVLDDVTLSRNMDRLMRLKEEKLGIKTIPSSDRAKLWDFAKEISNNN